MAPQQLGPGVVAGGVEETVLRPGLEEIATRHPSVGEVRGVGFMYAVELVRSQETREPLVPFNASGAAAGPMNEFAACSWMAATSLGCW